MHLLEEPGEILSAHLVRHGDGAFEQFELPPGTDRILVISQTPDGAIWLGTRSGALSFLDEQLTS